MDLGVRHIRSAGKGSGSVEVTLPGELRRLVGRPCRITLRDGARPDIVLAPDLAPALDAFAALWRGLADSLLSRNGGDECAAFPVADFAFGLHPAQGSGDAPYLSWEDGLALAAGSADVAAVARAVAACAAQRAGVLGIAPALASPFGAVCGFGACGTLAFAAWQEPCDIAAAALTGDAAWQPGAAWREVADTSDERFWGALAPVLAAAQRAFLAWSGAETPYPALRAAWRRGRSIEMNMG